MVTVYFETDGHADQVATFTHEDDYNTLKSVLEVMAKEAGYNKVTESIN